MEFSLVKRLVSCFIVIFFLSTEVHAASVVTDVDTERTEEGTKIKIGLSDASEYKVFILKNPDRLVVDIENTSWLAGNPSINNPVIKEVRHGIPEPGKLRLVFDLNEPADLIATKFIASSKNSLVITINGGALPKAVASGKPQPGKNKYTYKSSLPIDIPTFKPVKLQGYERSVLKKPSVQPDIDIPDKKPVFYKPKIVIDAGHGGVDPGAIGKSGMREKKITLQFALSLKKELERTGRYKVALTRSGDYFISLNDRVKKARNAGADLFISLHADSHPNPKTRGLSVYTLSEKRARWEADRLAKKAGREEVIKGVDLTEESRDVQQVLIDLAQRHTKNTSASFAEILVKELGDDAKLLERTHRFAGFAVLTGVDVPSVLVELGYLSNAYEEKLLRTSRYRGKIVKGMKDAVDKYFNKYKSE